MFVCMLYVIAIHHFSLVTSDEDLCYRLAGDADGKGETFTPLLAVEKCFMVTNPFFSVC